VTTLANFPINSGPYGGHIRTLVHEPRQCELDTATEWTLHLRADSTQQAQAIGRSLDKDARVAHQGYLGGDSWHQWAQRVDQPNVAVALHVYFRAPNLAAARQQVSVLAEVGPKSPYGWPVTLSTAGDWGTQDDRPLI
jgi:hypothetical protein